MKLVANLINILLGFLIFVFVGKFLLNIGVSNSFFNSNGSYYIYDIQDIIETKSNIFIGSRFYNCILIYDSEGNLEKVKKTYTKGKEFRFEIGINNGIEISRTFENIAFENKNFKVKSKIPFTLQKLKGDKFEDFICYSFWRSLQIGLNPLIVIVSLLITMFLFNLIKRDQN